MGILDEHGILFLFLVDREREPWTGGTREARVIDGHGMEE